MTPTFGTHIGGSLNTCENAALYGLSIHGVLSSWKFELQKTHSWVHSVLTWEPGYLYTKLHKDQIEEITSYSNYSTPEPEYSPVIVFFLYELSISMGNKPKGATAGQSTATTVCSGNLQAPANGSAASWLPQQAPAVVFVWTFASLWSSAFFLLLPFLPLLLLKFLLLS